MALLPAPPMNISPSASGIIVPAAASSRNLLAMLISVELILNSVDINFVVFNRFLFPEQLEGFFFTLFAIGISAAETAVAIAIIINIYRNIRNIEVKSLREMKW